MRNANEEPDIQFAFGLKQSISTHINTFFRPMFIQVQYFLQTRLDFILDRKYSISSTLI